MTISLEDVHTTIRGDLIGAPDQVGYQGPFIAERLILHCSKDLGTWVHVEGRAIKADGEIGRAKRHCTYDLDMHEVHPPAPDWLLEVLRDAGVTWS